MNTAPLDAAEIRKLGACLTINSLNSMTLHCGYKTREFRCLRLRLKSPSSPAHSGWLCANAVVRYRQVTVWLVGSSGVEPFRQFSAATSGEELLLLASGPGADECLRAFIEAECTFNPDDFDSDGYFSAPPKASLSAVLSPLLAIVCGCQVAPPSLRVDLGELERCEAIEEQQIVASGLHADEQKAVVMIQEGKTYKLEIRGQLPVRSASFKLLRELADLGVYEFQLRFHSPGNPLPTLVAVAEGAVIRMVPFERVFGVANYLRASEGAFALTLFPPSSPVEIGQIYAIGTRMQVHIAKDQTRSEAAASFYHEVFHLWDEAAGRRRGHPDPVVNRETNAHEAEAREYAKMMTWQSVPCGPAALR